MSSWTKLTPLSTKNNPCLNCPQIEGIAPLGKWLAVGFGSVIVTRDGAPVFDGERATNAIMEDESKSESDIPTVQTAEYMALPDPDHDWRIVFFGPLHGETYQRQGEGAWVLVETNRGFA